jgi:uncharacterized protein YdbL (DUF1318 family)
MRRLLIFAAVLFAAPATSQTVAIDSARAVGTVGERFDGYIGIAGVVSATVRSQVSTINIRRRSLYSTLAYRKGASPQDVGVTAGCTLLARTPVGGSYMLSDGAWRRRGAGQAVPLPDYCR